MIDIKVSECKNLGDMMTALTLRNKLLLRKMQRKGIRRLLERGSGSNTMFTDNRPLQASMMNVKRTKRALKNIRTVLPEKAKAKEVVQR